MKTSGCQLRSVWNSLDCDHYTSILLQIPSPITDWCCNNSDSSSVQSSQEGHRRTSTRTVVADVAEDTSSFQERQARHMGEVSYATF